MTKVQKQLQFETAPGKTGSRSSGLLVPVHSETWAFALSSGYLGGVCRDDQVKDVQTRFATNLLAFRNAVPKWALQEGEAGDRVVLRVARADTVAERGSAAIIKGPLRVSCIESACFATKADAANFKATYSVLPDVAADLVEMEVGGYEISEESIDLGGLETAPPASSQERKILDFLGGAAAGFLVLLQRAKFDDAVKKCLSSGAKGFEDLAQSFLIALDPSSEALDVEAWRATASSIWERFGNRGFDRSEFLADIASRLERSGVDGKSWISGCQGIIDGARELPAMSGGKNVGRRAALSFIMSHEAESSLSLSDSMGVGSEVEALAIFASHAFAGLMGLGAEYKRPKELLDGVLTIAEGLKAGRSLDVSFGDTRLQPDLSASSSVSVDGQILFTRTFSTSPVLRLLAACARESGLLLEPNLTGKRAQLVSGEGELPRITIEFDTLALADTADVELTVPLVKLSAKPTSAHLKLLLQAIRTDFLLIGLRPEQDGDAIHAAVRLQLSNLSGATLRASVDRLTEAWRAAGGKPAKSSHSKGKRKAPAKKTSGSSVDA